MIYVCCIWHVEAPFPSENKRFHPQLVGLWRKIVTFNPTFLLMVIGASRWCPLLLFYMSDISKLARFLHSFSDCGRELSFLVLIAPCSSLSTTANKVTRARDGSSKSRFSPTARWAVGENARFMNSQLPGRGFRSLGSQGAASRLEMDMFAHSQTSCR